MTHAGVRVAPLQPSGQGRASLDAAPFRSWVLTAGAHPALAVPWRPSTEPHWEGPMSRCVVGGKPFRYLPTQSLFCNFREGSEARCG